MKGFNTYNTSDLNIRIFLHDLFPINFRRDTQIFLHILSKETFIAKVVKKGVVVVLLYFVSKQRLEILYYIFGIYVMLYCYDKNAYSPQYYKDTNVQVF